MEPIRIETLHELGYAAENRMAVMVPGTVWEKPKPAAVLMQQQGTMILSLINKGMFIYMNQKKTKKGAREDGKYHQVRGAGRSIGRADF